MRWRPPQFANSPEPLALILREIGQGWAAKILGASAVIALPTVILAFFYGQSRIFFTVARDGLLPASLARVSSRGTPVRITIFTAIVTSVFAGLIPLDCNRCIGQCRDAGGIRRGVRRNAGLAGARARTASGSSAPRQPGWSGSSASSAASICSSACRMRTQIFFVAAQVIGLVLYAIYGQPRGGEGEGRCA